MLLNSELMAPSYVKHNVENIYVNVLDRTWGQADFFLDNLEVSLEWRGGRQFLLKNNLNSVHSFHYSLFKTYKKH